MERGPRVPWDPPQKSKNVGKGLPFAVFGGCLEEEAKTSPVVELSEVSSVENTATAGVHFELDNNAAGVDDNNVSVFDVGNFIGSPILGHSERNLFTKH